jgi:uncharacterized membrane protein
MIVNPYIPLGMSIGGVTMFYLLQLTVTSEQAGILFFCLLVLLVALDALAFQTVN